MREAGPSRLRSVSFADGGAGDSLRSIVAVAARVLGYRWGAEWGAWLMCVPRSWVAVFVHRDWKLSVCRRSNEDPELVLAVAMGHVIS